jgi:ankyrin repeat protein
LHFAIEFDHIDIVKHLVHNCKSNVDIQDDEGHTALHYAIMNDQLEILQYLLMEEGQPDISITDKNRKNVFDFAYKSKYRTDLVVMLLTRRKNQNRRMKEKIKAKLYSWWYFILACIR